MKKVERTIRSGNLVAALRWWSLPVLLAVCLGALLGAGCSSTGKSEPVHFASVRIQGQAPERVSDVATEVFLEHRYKVTRKGWAHLTFEKEGSTMNNIAYGNWMGGGVWVRVKVSVEEVLAGTCDLKCEAFLVRNRGESLEEEIRIKKLHSGQYQELLDEVAARFKGAMAKPD